MWLLAGIKSRKCEMDLGFSETWYIEQTNKHDTVKQNKLLLDSPPPFAPNIPKHSISSSGCQQAYNASDTGMGNALTLLLAL